MAHSKHKQFVAVSLALLFVLSLYSSINLNYFSKETLETTNDGQSIINQTTFPKTAGFTYTNLTFDSQTGITTIERPLFQWSATNGNGLSMPRTAGCSFYNDMTNEVYFMGGMVDPNPLQTGDETATSLIEIFDVTNGTWDPAGITMPYTQQYHDCVKIGTKVYAIGDHYPFTTPEIKATGMVQVLDLLTENWSNGTNMPSGKSVGLAGTTEHNGYLYIAGGVANQARSDPTDRLMRYDPVNDVWTEMANMSHKRLAFDLIPFHGKLIAYGGLVQYFDTSTNTTVIGTTNISEMYDPGTDTWTRLPNSTNNFASYASAVINDEIVIFGGYSGSGWMASINTKTFGYNPFTNTWRTHNTLQIGMYESTLVNAGGTLVYAGGEATQYPYYVWYLQYLSETGMYENPDHLEGWLTSSAIDLRSGTKGSASGIWLDFTAYEPTGTSALLQYRLATTAAGLPQANWVPASIPVNSFFGQSNLSLLSSLEDLPFLQYRVRFTSTELNDWIMPRMNYVTIGADEASLGPTTPVSMQPSSAPVLFQTHHHGVTMPGDYWIAFRESDQNGIYLPGSSWSTATYNSSTQQLSLKDVDQLLITEQVSISINSSDDQGVLLDWRVSLSKDVQSDYLVYRIGTKAQRNVTYTSPDLISLDKEVQVEVLNVISSFSSVGDSSLETGEVIPSTSSLQVEVDRVFKNSGLRMLEGDIEGRLHIDVRTFEEDEISGKRLWDNLTTEWFNLPKAQSYIAQINLAEGVSGNAHLWFEARTDQDWSLDVDGEDLFFTINADEPILMSTYPQVNSYSNEYADRVVGIEVYDVGGFTNQTLEAFLWIEAEHDGINGGSLDSYPQSIEFIPVNYSIENNINSWFLNVSVDDTVNDDHQFVHVLFVGNDVAGFNLPAPSNGLSHLVWETREASLSELLSFEITSEKIGTAALLEPSKNLAFELQVYDANDIDDITEIIVEIGGDNKLGILYQPHINGCSSLDARLLVTAMDCVVSYEADILTLQLNSEIAWSFSLGGLINGKLDVVVKDHDGTNRTNYENAWLLQKEMNIEIHGLRDVDGPIQNDIVENVIVMGEDNLLFEATLIHATSLTPYDGTVKLRWEGKIQLDRWTGGVDVDVEDGQIEFLIPTPMRSGLINEVKISVWDPLETVKIAEYLVPNFVIDATAPEILPSSMSFSVSRYKLDAVEVGVNIDEPQGWSGQLKLTCQIRSNDVTWDEITQIRNSTTVFDDKTMFTFLYNFSGQGDPSQLSAQASLACWASGSDDAGWALYSSTGNTKNDPWLLKSLSNKGPNLVVDGITWKEDMVAGESSLLEVRFYNLGEDIEVPFNVTIFTVVGDEHTIAKKTSYGQLSSDVITKINAYVDIPEGKWQLLVVLDSQQMVWELDETDNNYSVSYETSSSMFGAVVAGVGGGLALLAILGVILVRKRKNVDDEVANLDLGQIEEQVKVAPALTNKQPQPAPPKKRVGPPKTGPSPKKQLEESPQGQAQLHFSALDALLPAATETKTEQSTETYAKDYSQLPGGGQYEYSLDGTFYVGPTCGRWVLNEDNSFSKVD
ncbi:MAG: hypothetical protein O3A74_04680 [archaeon]|nr:hypothetical protein [archaeon]MDA0842684.1 hypothetical protein [archaeon]